MSDFGSLKTVNRKNQNLSTFLCNAENTSVYKQSKER